MPYIPPCCVPGCIPTNTIRHRFPSKDMYRSRFEEWKKLINNPTFSTMSDTEIAGRKRICDDHFEKKYKSSASHRLQMTAIPTLKLISNIQPEVIGKDVVDNNEMVGRCYLCSCEVSPAFRFPRKDPKRLKAWLDFCNMKDHQLRARHSLCHMHFTDTSFRIGFNRPGLIETAVPTLHPKGVEKPDDYEERVRDIVLKFLPSMQKEDRQLMNFSNYVIYKRTDTDDLVELNNSNDATASIDCDDGHDNNSINNNLPKNDDAPVHTHDCIVSSDEEDVYDVTKFNEDTCRLCAVVLDENKFSLFECDEDNRTLAEKVNCALPISVSQDDDLPYNVCLACKYNVERTYEFFKKIWQANMFLTDKHTDIPMAKRTFDHVTLETTDVPKTLHETKKDERREQSAVCHMCSYEKFQNKNKLEFHQSLHEQESIIVPACNICSEVLTTTSIHDSVHNQSYKIVHHLLPSVTQCECCKKCFIFEDKLLSHNKLEHEDYLEKFINENALRLNQKAIADKTLMATDSDDTSQKPRDRISGDNRFHSDKRARLK